MKKIIAALLGILTTTSLTHQVFATDINSKTYDSNFNLSVLSDNQLEEVNSDKEEEKNSVLIIGGKEITIKSSELKIINNNLMVPLKSTAESLGFKVTMEKDGVEIDNNEIRSIIAVGQDSYFYASSKYIGMSKPQSLGIAPIMENGNIYVPIKLYNLLYNDSKAVGAFKCIINNNKQIYILNGSIVTGWNKINNDWYYMDVDGVIKTGWIKDNNNWYFLYDNGVMAADTVTPDGYKVDSTGRWDFREPIKEKIQNPIVEYETVKEAENATKFKSILPSYVPENYNMINISVISNEILQILYKNNDNKILLRMGEFNSDTDISGDYNIYEKEEEIQLGSLKVNVKGNNELIYIAEWSKDNMRYALNISNGIEKVELLKIINSME